MGAPEIIFLVLFTSSITLNMANHGKPRPNYSAGMTVIVAIIWITLLTTGGFWK